MKNFIKENKKKILIGLAAGGATVLGGVLYLKGVKNGREYAFDVCSALLCQRDGLPPTIELLANARYDIDCFVEYEMLEYLKDEL